MTFNSAVYLLFLAAIVFLVRILPGRFRIPSLLVGCFVFYMWWRPEYVLLILLSVCIDYSVALRIEAAGSQRGRRGLLGLSVASNLGILFFFKYYELAVRTLRDGLGLAGFSPDFPELDLLLPIGISFYTFQTLSYTIEVFRGRFPAERRFPVFCLYVMFFPQLVAGPIERPQNLLPQLTSPGGVDASTVSQGLRRILWGLFKKMVIADRLAAIVDPVYAAPGEYGGPALAAATYAFAFQIYCDFSGYTDIAIGSARLLGIRLMENFRTPYSAASVGEFWGRWHISLSTWFRDYVYIPLGGNREGRSRWMAAVAATFLLSGFWHGANWTFVAWGGYHALLFLLSSGATAILPRRDGKPLTFRWLRVALTFHLVLAGWILFRSTSLGDALSVVSRLTADWGGGIWIQGVTVADAWVAVAAVAFLLVVDGLQGKEPIEVRFGRLSTGFRWFVYLVLTLVIFNLGAEQEIPFIYFQF